MDDIKDKIAKLLALADSSNENEAKAALLKARELMARYKLSMSDFVPENEAVVKETIGIFCTKMTDQWAVRLNQLIAGRYCCVSYRHRYHKRDKRVELGLIGFEEDFTICKRIMHYAYDCIKARCREITAIGKKSGFSGKELRESCNSYGWGFCAGLADAYQAQDASHQEWALVLTTPKPVMDTANGMNASPFAIANVNLQNHAAVRLGYADGNRFAPETRIAGVESRQALENAATGKPERSLYGKVG